MRSSEFSWMCTSSLASASKTFRAKAQDIQRGRSQRQGGWPLRASQNRRTVADHLPSAADRTVTSGLGGRASAAGRRIADWRRCAGMQRRGSCARALTGSQGLWCARARDGMSTKAWRGRGPGFSWGWSRRSGGKCLHLRRGRSSPMSRENQSTSPRRTSNTSSACSFRLSRRCTGRLSGCCR